MKSTISTSESETWEILSLLRRWDVMIESIFCICVSLRMPHRLDFQPIWDILPMTSQSVLGQGARAIYKTKTETYEELLARARLPTLYNGRLQDNATLMYKVKNNLAPSCLSRLFKTKNSQDCLRNWDFEIPRFNTTGYGKHTIRYQGPYIWFKLRKELRTSPTLAIFKTRIRKLDLSDLIDNNSSCCKLWKSWTESFYIIS